MLKYVSLTLLETGICLIIGVMFQTCGCHLHTASQDFFDQGFPFLTSANLSSCIEGSVLVEGFKG